MKLSVIIPCKNEAGVVEYLLDSLANQTSPVDEIIVIDSHSTDQTAASVASYEAQLPVQVITAIGKGVAYARNEGVEAATGELLLFVDADIQLPPHFIASLREQVAARSLEVGGFTVRMPQGSPNIRLGTHIMNSYVRLMAHTPWPIFFSCFFATKKTHEKIEGFDPAIWIMEDYDYAYRAKKAGAKFGLIRGTHFNASPRRFEKGAGLNIGRAIYAELYRYTHGMRLTKPLFKYDMGGTETPPGPKQK